MDIFLSHKVAGVREAIEAVGAELRYLPPYSPDLCPTGRSHRTGFFKAQKTSARRSRTNR